MARGAAGMPMPPCIIPSSQHGAGPIIGAAPGPQGSQTGPQGAPMTGPGAARCPQGERNSMNDGRRQLLPPPKQLLHPGAAVRADRASAKQTNRDMTKTSRQGRRSGCRRGPTSCEIRTSSATTPKKKYLIILGAAEHGEGLSGKAGSRQRPLVTVVRTVRAARPAAARVWCCGRARPAGVGYRLSERFYS